MNRAQLEAAYRRTDYEVQTPDGPMLLRIDEHCPRLQGVHAKLGVTESVFLTAWNPQSVPQCAPRNAVAQAHLDQRLAALKLTILPGWGRDPQGSWPAEQSLFVAGLDRDTATGLAKEFGQHAFVHAGADAIPRLVWVQGAQ
ncbi:MAG TPA: DUF3293 domain-containing protein [Steroidobacteraceae bacterium]|nr:DUF3293 domain-containing protein [Steroidobacteraceae bacterium]